MNLDLDRPEGMYVITAQGAGFVAINGENKGRGLILTPKALVEPWAELGFSALTEADFRKVAEVGATVTVIGTGSRQRFPSPALLRPLIESGRGFEIMDTAAACRTYNILASEGRNVAAALIIDAR